MSSFSVLRVSWANVFFSSAKRIALGFENIDAVPVDLRQRELVVPAHSYGQRFCKRSMEEEEVIPSSVCVRVAYVGLFTP